MTAETADGGGVRLLSVLAFGAGPVVALLHETGTLELGPSASLWPIAIIVLVAGLGLSIGVRVATHKRRWIGLLIAIPNGLVVMFYGFLLLFFGLGGSR